ncbi:AP-4 complex subunit beta-1 [Anabrus simplex]|uniref:AP-4 complex subunit beta-1 n=1 Tax=Anabrus simplex TaxID=316456 RepID=UPI0035A2C1BE
MQAPEVLAANLLKESINPNSPDFKILLYQLQEAVNSPGDLSCLIGPVVKLLPCHNFQVKKIAYSALPRICIAHPDAAVLAVNRILLDCRDPNPAVKCLAVTTLCSLPTLLAEHSGPTLNAALKDGNPRVRRAAVNGCSKIWKYHPTLLQELGFIDRLYESIRDSDPVVVTNSLLVLDMVLAIEGGVVVNRNMAAYLLKRLGEFPDAQLATVLQVLGKYIPDNEEELFLELSILDAYLIHQTSAAVVVNCIHLFLLLTEKQYPHLQTDIIQRVVPGLQTFLQVPSSKESVIFVLDFLLRMKIQNKMNWLDAFANYPQLFFPNEREEFKISSKKLQLLPYVCTEDNCEEVLQVLRGKYCCNLQTSKEAISCVCLISTRLPIHVGNQCLQVLKLLMDCKEREVCDNVLHALQDVDLHRYKRKEIQSIVEKVIDKVDISQRKLIPNILPVFLGEFGELIDTLSPYVLETLVSNFETYKEDGTRNLILLAALKMFLKMPAKCQHILGELFEKCITLNCHGDSPSIELQNKAQKYFHLLKMDVKLVQKLLMIP